MMKFGGLRSDSKEDLEKYGGELILRIMIDLTARENSEDLEKAKLCGELDTNCNFIILVN